MVVLIYKSINKVSLILIPTPVRKYGQPNISIKCLVLFTAVMLIEIIVKYDVIIVIILPF